jgi:hypothetical protein
MKNGTYLTANIKEKLVKEFEKFILSGFQKTKFTKALYKHLSLNFGFIAHYDLNGFYEARFADPIGRVQTFTSIIDASLWCFKDENTGGNADLNTAIREIALKYAPTVNGDAKEQRKKDLREQIATLQKELFNLENGYDKDGYR